VFAAVPGFRFPRQGDEGAAYKVGCIGDGRERYSGAKLLLLLVFGEAATWDGVKEDLVRKML
jgi:hypothetical protein